MIFWMGSRYKKLFIFIRLHISWNKMVYNCKEHIVCCKNALWHLETNTFWLKKLFVFTGLYKILTRNGRGWVQKKKSFLNMLWTVKFFNIWDSTASHYNNWWYIYKKVIANMVNYSCGTLKISIKPPFSR
jgi:hypothetical protein